jgi:hypothetical protein
MPALLRHLRQTCIPACFCLNHRQECLCHLRVCDDWLVWYYGNGTT